MKDLMTVFAKVIRDGLNVREGEVITKGIIDDRVGNLTMGLLAVLPSYHRLKLRREAGDIFWTAIVDGFPGQGVGGSPRAAVASCLSKIFETGTEEDYEGACLLEIPDFSKALRDFHLSKILPSGLLSGCGQTEADNETSAVEKGDN